MARLKLATVWLGGCSGCQKFCEGRPFSFFSLRPWGSWRFVYLSIFFTTHLGLL